MLSTENLVKCFQKSFQNRFSSKYFNEQRRVDVDDVAVRRFVEFIFVEKMANGRRTLGSSSIIGAGHRTFIIVVFSGVQSSSAETFVKFIRQTGRN